TRLAPHRSVRTSLRSSPTFSWLYVLASTMQTLLRGSFTRETSGPRYHIQAMGGCDRRAVVPFVRAGFVVGLLSACTPGRRRCHLGSRHRSVAARALSTGR